MSDDRTVPESTHAALDRVADLAADLFDASVAGIVLKDDGADPAMVAGLGLGTGDAVRLHALCAGAMAGTDVLVAADAAIDPRLGSPATQRGTIRFLAAAALVDRDGSRLGLLCVADRMPHPPVPDRMRARLAALAALAVDILSCGYRPPGRGHAAAVVSAPMPPASRASMTPARHAAVGESVRTAISA